MAALGRVDIAMWARKKFASWGRKARAWAQNREFEVAADETWGLAAGQAGVLLPLRLYWHAEVRVGSKWDIGGTAAGGGERT